MGHHDATVASLFDPEPDSPYARLFARRILFLRGPLEGDAADELAAQLLALDAQSPDDVTLLIDSPGGDIAGMFALHDTIQLMRARVHTRCVGLAASEAAFVLATGTGVRSATPNARIMLRQPAGSAQGSAVDIVTEAEQLALQRERVERILADRTGQPVERIHADTQHELWLSAGEALDYGIIDQVAGRDRGA